MAIRLRTRLIRNEHRLFNKQIPDDHEVKVDLGVEPEVGVVVPQDTDPELVPGREQEIGPDRRVVRKLETRVELVDATTPQVGPNLVRVPRRHPSDVIVTIGTIVITNDTNTIEIDQKNVIAPLLTNNYLCIQPDED